MATIIKGVDHATFAAFVAGRLNWATYPNGAGWEARTRGASVEYVVEMFARANSLRWTISGGNAHVADTVFMMKKEPGPVAPLSTGTMHTVPVAGVYAPGRETKGSLLQCRILGHRDGVPCALVLGHHIIITLARESATGDVVTTGGEEIPYGVTVVEYMAQQGIVA